MTPTANFIAADLGASSGRLMVGRWNGRLFSLEPLHRFPNTGVRAAGNLYWDALGIWSHLQEGLSQYRSRYGDSPQGIGVDAWGVDFALLDRAGRLAGNPFHYRDSRTNGMPPLAFEKVPEQKFFFQTGVRTMQINTLFQLYSMVHAGDPQLEIADALLMIPDLFLYLLSGERSIEYSEATTTQMYSPSQGDWARELLGSLGIPLKILSPVVQPGTLIGSVRADVLRDAGLGCSFPAIAVASHDTASAVAAIPSMDRNSAFISSGTWSLMGVEIDEPNTSEEAFRRGLTNEGGADGSILLMRNLTGLWIIQECLRQWEKEGHRRSWEEIVSAAAQAAPFPAHFDPNAKEFQSPGDMPKAIHDYCLATGQQPPHTVGEIARSTFESLSLSYRSVLESLELVTGRHMESIRVVGGGSLNGFLCQMIADACDRPVIAGPVEASAFGNIMLQAVATGHLQSLRAGREALAGSVECNSFAPHRSDAWDEAYSRFNAIAQRP
ncbi:MAG TPA: rhamnulokinase family protein [Acidobacteriaceae bacterium]|nr:rhamnulokinase family protein [Acidobacteriaceae bacterium]